MEIDDEQGCPDSDLMLPLRLIAFDIVCKVGFAVTRSS